MSHCLQPGCLNPNPNGFKFCQKCGAKLLLAERYRAIKIIGQGGFGRTFRATDEFKPSKPACVIKQFLPQAQGTDTIEKAAELFQAEAVRLDDLGKHPQIPELLAYFIQDERQYLVQEFIDGDNLGQELEEKGKFNEKQIRELLTDILNILDFVHEKEVIHRDIKPENIIRRAQDNKLVLVDFGAAKVVANKRVSVTGTVIGSAEYTSPEQGIGKAIYASDLYSLGVTCIHLLTQVSPFDLYDTSESDWVWRDYLLDNRVSDELGKILDKLIVQATRRRYQSAKEVLEALTPPTALKIQVPQANSSPPTSGGFTVQVPQAISFSPTSGGGISLKDLLQKSKLKMVISPRKRWISEIQRLRGLMTVFRNFARYLKTFQFEIVTVDHRGKETNRRPGQAQYFTAAIGNGATMDFVAIPGGKFLMGSPASEAERGDSEGPVHEVTVPPFFMGKYQVTQLQWEKVMGNNPSCFKGPNRPVENVSWHDCVKFCEKVSQNLKKDVRLASEAEWEYACRAQTVTPFHFGETLTTDLANYNGEYTYGSGPQGVDRSQTTDVGSFPPNAFGLYDMHGNVWEWCADNWHENYQNAPNNGSVWTGGDEVCRVLRGGCWLFIPYFCRSALRYRDEPVFSYGTVGFRLVFSS